MEVGNQLRKDQYYWYRYDDEGRLVERVGYHGSTRRTRTLYTWDFQGRLTAVEHFYKSDGYGATATSDAIDTTGEVSNKRVEYAYDGLGRRAVKQVDEA